MLIVGELLNSSRPVVQALLETQDKAALQEITLSQEAAGAHYLDLNCGVFVDEEADRLCWLIDVVQEVSSLPLCLDSPSAKTLARALPHLKNGQPLINSINAEKEHYRQILPLVQKYKAKIVALAMDDKGIPATAEDRFKVARHLFADLVQAGVAPKDIYLDMLVQPIATADNGAMPFLRAVGKMGAVQNGIQFIAGLSNVSYGLPNRKVLNRCFLIQAIAAGIENFILNPLDKELMGAYYAARAVAGRDKFCSGYLKAHRTGYYTL